MRRLLCAGLLGSTLLAQQPRWQFLAEADVQAQVQPTAGQLVLAASLRRAFAGENLGQPRRYLQAGLSVNANPAYATPGLFVEAAPWACVALRLQQDALRYFGASGALLPVDGPQLPYGDAVLRDPGGRAQVAWGQRSLAQLRLQGQVGLVVAQYQVSFARHRFQAEGSWFYDWDTDLLLRDGDHTRRDTASLGLEWITSRLTWYPGLQWEARRGIAAGLHTKRAGLALAFEHRQERAGWGRPRGALLVGQILEDRNRKGAWFLQGSLGSAWSL